MDTSFIRTNWIAIVAVIFFIYLALKPSGCNQPDEEKPTVTTTTETKQEPQPPVYVPVYIPQQTGATSYPVVIPQQYQPSADLEKLLTQYNDLVKEYLAVRTYKDSIQLKDSSGNRVGVVNLNDKVSENKLQPREVDYQLSFPHTTTTITIKEPYKPRNQVFLGVGITGTTKAPLNGGYTSVLFKNKKDGIIGANAGIKVVNGAIEPEFSLSKYFKLSFKK